MEEIDLINSPSQQLTNNDIDGPDPRIQAELEKLNASTDTINKLEVDLDEARNAFRQLLVESTQRFDSLAKKLGKCVEQARPYYDARIKAKQALTEGQAAAVRYERSVSQHTAAREMVYLAEEGLLQRGCEFDQSWQEMLNHATSKVNAAEKERVESSCIHRIKSKNYHDAENRVRYLQKELKRAIAKSSLNARRSLLQINNLARMHQLQLLPYFELKSSINQQLELQKKEVLNLEEGIALAKLAYSEALSNLEYISEEIHETRKTQLDIGVRGVGVGAECPTPVSAFEQSKLLCRNTSLEELNNEFKQLSQESSPRTLPILPKEISDNFVNEIKRFPLIEDCDDKNRLEENYHLTSQESEEKQNSKSNLLSEWQVISINKEVSSSCLSVGDQESVISDSESLASIEMLSDEAIAGLMLEEDLNELSHNISSAQHTPVVESLFYFDSSCKDLHSVNDSNLVSLNHKRVKTAAIKNEINSGSNKPEEARNVAQATTKRPDSLPLFEVKNKSLSAASLSSSASEASSPEAATPGYAILNDTPESPAAS